MPSHFLILLVIIAGYLFNHRFYRFRFRAQTLAGHRLILEAATSGLVFLAGARILAWAFREFILPQETLTWWWSFSGELHLAGTSVLTLVLAFVAAPILNVCIGFKHRDRLPLNTGHSRWLKHVYRWWGANREYSLDKAVHYYGDALQKLLHQAATRSQFGLSLGVTLENRKIYAGVVIASPNLFPTDKYISLLPWLSGHRDKDSLEIVYDFVYPASLYEKLEDLDDVVLALPVSEIKSAHMLDEVFYEREIQRLEAQASTASGDAGSGS